MRPIEDIAREAGLFRGRRGPWMSIITDHGGVTHDDLLRFAAIVRAEALEEAAAEAMKQTTHRDDPNNEVWQCAYNHVAGECAAAIRALATDQRDKPRG